MRKYENHIQKIKSEVYQKVAEYAFDDSLEDKKLDIANEINPGPNPRFRCCIYHERAVTNDRIKISLGGNEDINNQVEVLGSACDRCQENRYVVTDTCRGCLAHRCQSVCPVDAIKIVNNKAYIDSNKCIECGKCHKSCPYNAIADVRRPCIKVCTTGALSIDKNKKAVIDNELCIRCGACVYYCPFGAIQDKSQIISVIEELKEKNNNLYAIVAPSIAAQFGYTQICRVITAIKMLGFKDVVEVALGADLVIGHEAEEFAHCMEEGKSFMTSSCCPAFVQYINLKYPELKQNISTTISPMIATARLVKSIDEKAKVVFIGPCIAKKDEAQYLNKSEVDYVLTFEELTGMILGKGIDIDELPTTPLDNASYFGRNFAGVGGVTKALRNTLSRKNPELEYETLVCDGIQECDKALKLAKVGRLNNTFIEGMYCTGGCIKGPVTMHYGAQDKKALNKYCEQAKEKDIDQSLRVFNVDRISLEK